MPHLIIPGEGDPLDPENFYSDAKATTRKHGTILIDGKERASTLQCVHCNAHFTHRKDRGDFMCLKCYGPVCGRQPCLVECTPFEKKLDAYERGKSAVLR